jgi:hypothetical protein
VTEHRHRRPSPRTIILAVPALQAPAQSLGEEDTALRTIWVVSWRGLDEEFPSAADAMDRLDQLEARGIEAEMFEIMTRRRRRIG